MEHETEFLNTFFAHLSHLYFDKAKEHVEREKDNFRTTISTPWVLLVGHLPQIIFAEKSYIELGCLTIRNKGFLRKENSLRAMYDALRLEMKRLEDVAKVTQAGEELRPLNEKPLTRYITEFLTARIDLIDLYEKLYNLGTAKHFNYSSVYTHIQTISNTHASTFSHLALMPIRAVVKLEMEILLHLLGALQELQALQFIPAVTLLYGAHMRLTTWENSLQNRESWKLGFTASFLKNNPHPLLFQWMVKLKAAAISKFSLYFHRTLAKQTTPNEMRQLCAKQNVDFFNKIQVFQRRYDALLGCLLFDNRGPDNFPEEETDFFVIVSCPTKPIGHFVNKFETIVTERSIDLDRNTYVFVPKDNNMYVISNVEPRIYIMVIFDNKRSEKDTYIANFINDICAQLRFTKNFLNLKISSK